MSDPYDPDEVGEKRRGSQYVSRKDVKIVGIILLVLAIAAWPIYRYGVGQANNLLCNKNVRKIGEAMLAYAKDSDDHFPYAYETDGYNTKAIATHGGFAYSWHWAVQPYTTWDIFHCPTAEASEHTTTADPYTGKQEYSDYGMMNAYSGVAISTIDNPNQRIVVGESAKNGGNGTYDPFPLYSKGAILHDDGFVIGFDGLDAGPGVDQDYPTAKTKYMTRLAFPNTAGPNFSHDSAGRHPDGIHYLTVAGGLRAGDATTAEVIRLGGYGMWEVPKPVR